MPDSRILIIIPILNEAAGIDALLDQLLPLRAEGCELVLVDGGSQDRTVEIARGRLEAAQLLHSSKPERAQQMQLGLVISEAEDIIWFLHADSRIKPESPACIRAAISSGASWGRFDVRLSGRNLAFRVIEWFMNQRSLITGICTGDQGIFVTNEALQASGGIPLQPLMEDIELAIRLKQHSGHPARIRTPLVTSSRKWEQNGILRTTLLMWRLRLAYFYGASPESLAQLYYKEQRSVD